MPISASEVDFLEQKAYKIRSHIINTIINNGEGHAGPALSCTDILAVLYMKVMNVDPNNPLWPERDRFLLSGGHKCLALYGALVEKGYIKAEILNGYNKLGTLVPGHPDMKKIKGIDFSTGSLGHGLPIGCGMALGAKLKGAGFKVYVLMGDGEQGEGSIWEAASFAAHKKLDNLVAILDRNGLQINGTTKDVANTSPLEERYRSFGWAVKVIDGHSIKEIFEALESAPVEQGKPTMIIANTIKSKGMSFAEGNYKYHHWHPGKEEAEKALNELEEYGEEVVIMNKVLKDPRKVFSNTLLALGMENQKVLAVSCDSASGSGMSDFIKEFPERYIEIGISEQNAIGVCAGLAEAGFVPVVSAIAPFISMRCYEQIRNDVGYSNMNVKIIGSSSGLSHSTLGSTHQAVEDICLMRTIPNMVVLNPGDAYEVEMALKEAVKHNGPVYIRMPRHAMEDIEYPGERNFKLGIADELAYGEDVAIIASGTLVREAQKASDILKSRGINTGVINVHTVKPLDTKMVECVCKNCKMIFTVEEHSVVGGLGSTVTEFAAGLKKCIPVHILGIKEGSTDNGPYRELLNHYSLTGEKLAEKIQKIYIK